MTTPCVSVILPVYNGATDVPAAIASVLGQSFGDFELIAIDDGSPGDDSLEVLNRIASESGDARLKVVALTPNRGLAGALNHGLSLARGRYIARQDQDDISLPDRLQRQVAFLEANPACGMVGTRAEIWQDEKPTGRFHDHPTDTGRLKLDLLSNNPFVHSSVMLRRDVFAAVGEYCTDRSRQPPEDYELWSRVARHCDVANLPERLLIYREVPTSMSRDAANPFRDKVLMIAAENIAWWAGMPEPDAPCLLAAALVNAAYDRVPIDSRVQPALERMRSAATAIAAAHPRSDLDAEIQQLLANLSHHHEAALASRTTLPVWAMPIATLGRRLNVPARIKAKVRSWLAQ
jgi:CheY-like chemotaxis protein